MGGVSDPGNIGQVFCTLGRFQSASHRRMAKRTAIGSQGLIL
jgi:hypothetical protein